MLGASNRVQTLRLATQGLLRTLARLASLLMRSQEYGAPSHIP